MLYYTIKEDILQELFFGAVKTNYEFCENISPPFPKKGKGLGAPALSQANQARLFGEGSGEFDLLARHTVSNPDKPAP
jgi:hypothetical protein